MSLEARVTDLADGRHVELVGVLDETAQLPGPREIAGRRLILDLGGVTLINSLGCRRFVTWVGELAVLAGEVTLERLSAVVVNQVSTFANVIPPRARIFSFFVPYACPACRREARVLYPSAGFHPDAVPEFLDCAPCGGRKSLDVSRPAYFRFLTAG